MAMKTIIAPIPIAPLWFILASVCIYPSIPFIVSNEKVLFEHYEKPWDIRRNDSHPFFAQI
jgi:hypothetical protein